MPVIEFHIDDVVRLRKPHPCGGSDWIVIRLGADIGLRCIRCKRRLLLSRPILERRLKEFREHRIVGAEQRNAGATDG